jgi:hypothetical protein
MLNQIVQYEIEYKYNRYTKMMITSSEVETTIIPSNDFVECCCV